MAELWLPREDRYALWLPDLDQVRVVGWRPGPAGISVVELADGFQVAVDHASLTTLTEITIDLSFGRDDLVSHLPFLEALLGEDVADEVLRLPNHAAADQPVPLGHRRRRALRDDLERERDDDRRGAGAGAFAFARLALGADLGEDGALSDQARALGFLEAAGEAIDLVPSMATNLVERGLDLLELATPVLDPKRRARISGFVANLAARLPDGPVRSRLRTYVPASAVGERADAAELPLAMLSAPVAAAAPLSSSPMGVAPSAVTQRSEGDTGVTPLEVDGPNRAWAALEAHGTVRITASRSAENLWGRVFRRSDRLLLGLSPLRVAHDGERQTSATVLIPPTPAHDLVVDLTDDPSSPRRAPQHDHVRHAVRLGRAAARLNRRHDPDATVAWRACADAWELLGDTQRANFARQGGLRDDRRGSARFADPGNRPLLADDAE